MAIINKNQKVGKDTYLLEVEGKFEGLPGQFYMIKSEHKYPLLARPLSIFEITDDTIKFLYRVVGDGTELLSRQPKGTQLILRGPYGKGFPQVKGSVALVGGGMGAAPLYEAGKQLKNDDNITTVDLYLGFSDELVLEDQWPRICSSFFYNIGGFITAEINVANYDVIFTCGPDVMMKKLTHDCKKSGVKIYVSKESHMACGIGACLACNCSTKSGNKKVCKEGPVFLGEEIYDV